MRLAVTAAAGRGGAIVLVQGAPGAGKTALLHEFGVRAQKQRWHVLFDLDPRSLYNPAVLAHATGKSYVSGETRGKQLGAGADIGVLGVGSASIDAGGTRAQSYAARTIQTVAESLVGKKHVGLLMIIDEVQNAAMVQEGVDRAMAAFMLDWIHNGSAKVPLILLAGGLEHSRKVLDRQFGISRLSTKSGLINLGRVSQTTERYIIRDWLVKDGGAQSSTSLGRWLTAIARETDCWPQHIHCYASEAAAWLHRHGGQLTREVPGAVMDAGAQRKETYYALRLDGIDRSYCELLAQLVAGSGHGQRLTRQDIVRTFMQADIPDLITEEQRAVAASQTFDLAVEKGVVETTADSLYRVPIPSMQRWLARTYGGRSRDGGTQLEGWL